MSWFLFFVATASTLLLLRRLLRVQRLVRELEQAARSKRRLMPRESGKALQSLGIYGLVRELNAAVDHYNRHQAQNAGYSKQVEAMLRAVQEVVIVFDAERKVEFANRSAELLFREGKSLNGLRLEGVMRSLTLLELLDASGESKVAEPRQIHLEQGGETLWFEASCARVRSVSDVSSEREAESGSHSTLLVLHDITQLKRLEVLRRDFVANVSHELRTPLTIIKGYAETLVEDDDALNAQSRVRFLGKIVTNADRLNVLVEDLLTLSRLESKPDQLEPRVQSLRSLIEETLENYRARIGAEPRTIELQYDERVGDFAFDRYRINQVLDNLLENVFRYAPGFTRISVSVQLDEAQNLVVGSVSDDGPGIPEKDLPYIFGRFYRVDKGRSRERGGTGLGLSIVKHIIQLHGGSVHAESPLQDKRARHAVVPKGEGGQATPESGQAKAGTRIVFTLPYHT